jgi:flagellar basal-body rod modification protein FlgD
MTTISGNFLTSQQYEQSKLVAPSDDEALGRDAFLKLLTTQLQNQDPLNPMENEAFVSQLAEFSSVEGIKGMQASLETMVTSMRSDQLLSGANLVGRSVGLGSTDVRAAGGLNTELEIDLAQTSSNVSLQVISNTTGQIVYQGDLGPQTAGTVKASWPGVDTAGNDLPIGSYSFMAVSETNGRRIEQPIAAVSRVNSVVWNPATQNINLDLSSGASVAMNEIDRIST